MADFWSYVEPPVVKMGVSGAVCGCVVLSGGYVASLYVWQGAMTTSRNDPDMIKKRMLSVASVTLASPIYLGVFTKSFAVFRQAPSLAALRLVASDVAQATSFKAIGLGSPMSFSGYPLVLTATLFLGPLVMSLLDKVEDYRISSWHDLKSVLRDQWRDLRCGRLTLTLRQTRNVLVAPVSEEVVFRACCLPLLVAAGVRHTPAVFICPLFFGSAHVHHAIELHLQGYKKRMILFNTVFQFGYTYLFGAFASFVFLRSQHLPTIILMHMFCNHIGFPEFGSMPHHPQRRVVCGSLFLGIAGFYYKFLSWSK